MGANGHDPKNLQKIHRQHCSRDGRYRLPGTLRAWAIVPQVSRINSRATQHNWLPAVRRGPDRVKFQFSRNATTRSEGVCIILRRGKAVVLPVC